MSRVEEWPRGAAPEGVRFLTAAIDVQAARFVITVIGWGVDLESWLVDRFVISSSKRPEGDRFAALDPAAYAEDWNLIGETLFDRRYPAQGHPEIQLPILMTLCDSGGREGVTEKAYDYWRRLGPSGHGRKFRLVKGTGNPNAPRVQKTWPDSRGRKDRAAGARGDVPVWILNVNVLKDGIAGDLGRDEPGPGYHHIPAWIDADYFSEITAETRTHKGWVKPAGARNEALDLHVYNRAACILLGGERIQWKQPPSWAAPPDTRAIPPGAGVRVESEGGEQPEIARTVAAAVPARSGWVNRTGRWMK
jgi:phage terminase large subunit GpA-like protein